MSFNIKNILILYGSTTGNTQRLAKYIKTNLSNATHKITMSNVASLSYPFSIDNKYHLIILCCPTWGIEPAVLQEDFEYWQINTVTKSLHNKNFAIFAIGDNTYPHFAYSYEILSQYLKQHAGNIYDNLSIKIQDPWENSINHIEDKIALITNTNFTIVEK